jgi:formate/nitrite transporter FocA (FNT family)
MFIVDIILSKLYKMNNLVSLLIMFILIGVASLVVMIEIGTAFYLLKLVFFTLAGNTIGGYFLILLWIFILYKIATK